MLILLGILAAVLAAILAYRASEKPFEQYMQEAYERCEFVGEAQNFQVTQEENKKEGWFTIKAFTAAGVYRMNKGDQMVMVATSQLFCITANKKSGLIAVQESAGIWHDSLSERSIKIALDRLLGGKG